MILRLPAPGRAAWLIALACAALVAGCDRAPDAVGRNWSSLPELQHAMEDEGWVLVGRVGALPGGERARVTATEAGRDALTFAAPDGTPHSYEGFEGYDLRLLRLESDSGAQMSVVFRARDARPPEAE